MLCYFYNKQMAAPARKGKHYRSESSSKMKRHEPESGLPKSRDSEGAATHGLQQWAADTTHCGWMRVPPQKWKFMKSREAWCLIE